VIDIKAMRDEGRAKVERKPVKTFLTDEAVERVRKVAEFTGLHMYEVIERLILTELPELAQLGSNE